ncbi:hypothetical protein QBC47DRAFT_92028 [Echria macrotheca]|uniref:Uncharacterized protein n=1 Tax=Echria macrotheca TaxID=438768 RepID=A0AAJ0B2Y5_9PEZI|nr:hypothetical protein QBC47DRAFT_92028 [Echria macrotheca]
MGRQTASPEQDKAPAHLLDASCTAFTCPGLQESEGPNNVSLYHLRAVLFSLVKKGVCFTQTAPFPRMGSRAICWCISPPRSCKSTSDTHTHTHTHIHSNRSNQASSPQVDSSHLLWHSPIVWLYAAPRPPVDCTISGGHTMGLCLCTSGEMEAFRMGNQYAGIHSSLIISLLYNFGFLRKMYLHRPERRRSNPSVKITVPVG